MQKVLIGLAVVLFILIAYMHMSQSSEHFQTAQQIQYRKRIQQENKINPGFGNKLGRMENRITDPLDPRLWNQIAKRAGQYDGGFADVVMTLQDRQSIPSIKNLSV
jgi:hypothetical protein